MKRSNNIHPLFICLVRSPFVTHLGVVVHEPHEPLDEVVHEAEGARLAPVPVDGDVLPAQGLDDEVAHHTPVCDASGRHNNEHKNTKEKK